MPTARNREKHGKCSKNRTDSRGGKQAAKIVFKNTAFVRKIQYYTAIKVVVFFVNAIDLKKQKLYN